MERIKIGLILTGCIAQINSSCLFGTPRLHGTQRFCGSDRGKSVWLWARKHGFLMAGLQLHPKNILIFPFKDERDQQGEMLVYMQDLRVCLRFFLLDLTPQILASSQNYIRNPWADGWGRISACLWQAGAERCPQHRHGRTREFHCFPHRAGKHRGLTLCSCQLLIVQAGQQHKAYSSPLPPSSSSCHQWNPTSLIFDSRLSRLDF